MPKSILKPHEVSQLMSLGLSENEAGLYWLMLKNPAGTVQELKLKSPLPRTMLYYVLRRLVNVGLITPHKQGWRTVYVAEDPERLYDLLSRKERAFAENAEGARRLIPELKKDYRLAGNRPGTRILSGLPEYQEAWEDVLISESDKIFIYDDLGAKKPGREIREEFNNKRISKKIVQLMLVFDTPANREQIKSLPYNDYTQYRFIPKSTKTFAAHLVLYNGKMMYATYGNREPSALIIEDQNLFNMQLSLFNSLWQAGQDATLLYTKKL